MNPVLPLLALLSLAGLLARRRGIGLAWAVSGLAGMLLLHAALRIPDGIPSPSATLAQLAPWQAALATGHAEPPAVARGNPLLRDVTFQIEPWLLFLRAELRAGRLPFWNPWQFGGAPFWANGQSAPLFPLHWLFVVLPLRFGFVLLPWLRIAIGGCGAFALARALGVREPAALLAAVVYPLSGMYASFLLFPMGNALALVPWVFWAVERLVQGKAGWRTLAIVLSLQMLAGHPETVLHTGLLVGIYVVVRAGRAAPWGSLLLGTGAAASVAAVQWLPLALALGDSSRWHATAEGAAPDFGTLFLQPLRLLLPQLYGHPALGTWWGPFNYSATAVYVGAIALPLAIVGLHRARAERPWRALAVLTLFSLLAAYHVPLVHDALVALPLLGRALHHRLLFGVELGLAVLAAAGLDAWLEGRARWLVASTGIVALGLALAWARFAADWRQHGTVPEMAASSVLLIAVALALVLGHRLPSRWRAGLVAVIVAAAACELVVAHGAINPGLSLRDLYPPSSAADFLRGREGRVIGTGETLRPNAAMVYGLADLRGDDPLKSRRFADLYGHLSAPDPVYFQPVSDWDPALLDALAVRWVVAGRQEEAPDPSWRLAFESTQARVFERTSALAAVRFEHGDERAHVQTVLRAPGRWDILWSTPRADRLVVAESFDRGWSGRNDGIPARLELFEPAMIAVTLGPGSGRLTLRYTPPGLALGGTLSALGVLALLFRVRKAT